MRENRKNNKIRELFLNQKGMALLTTLIFIFVIGTLAVALLTMTSNDTKLSALQRDSTKAFYLADAGIQRSIKELKDDFGWDGHFNDENGEGFVELGDGTYTVVVKHHKDDPSIPENQVRVTSTGRVAKSKRKIIVFVKSTSSGGSASPIFKYAIASKNNIETGWNIGVYSYPENGQGDVYCLGKVELRTGSIIDGDTNIQGKIDIPGNTRVTGNVNTDSDVFLSAGGIIEGSVDALGKVTVSGAGAEIKGNVSTEKDVFLKNSGKIDGNISSGGKVVSSGSSGNLVVGKDIGAAGTINMRDATVDGSINSNQNITLNSRMTVNGGINTLGDLNLEGWTSIVNGDIKSNKDIFINEGWHVMGDAWAHDEITGNGTVEGTKHPNQPNPVTNGATIAACEGFIPEEEFPVIDTEPYKNEAMAGGTYEGNLTISGESYDLENIYITGNLYIYGDADVTLGGTVYVAGNVKVENKVNFKKSGIIIADGNITLGRAYHGQTYFSDDNKSLIISTNGNIDIKSNNTVYASMYAPEGKVSIIDDAFLYGAVIAKKYKQTQGSKVYYDVSLGEGGGGGTGSETTISIVSWQEIY